MKILFIHPAYMDYRGYIFQKLNENYNICFIFTKQGRGQENVKEEHENIPDEWKSKNLRSGLFIGQKDIGMYLALVKELLFGDYDVILTSTSWYICWIGAKFRRKKFIFMTEFWYWRNTSIQRCFLNLFTKLIAKKADSIFAMGTNAYNSYIEMGIQKSKIFMHPQCAMDYSTKPKFDLRKKYNLNDKKIILFIGRIVSLKGINNLIEAFSKVEKIDRQAFLIIAGDGPKKKEYENIAKKLMIKNILFTGHVSKKEISSYYSACDIFVLPSIFYGHTYEPWGLVINEAMAFGKPIITTNAVGAGTDLVQDGKNGYIVEAGNVDELHDALKKILFSEQLREKMCIESRRIFETKNDYDAMFKVLKNSIDYLR